MGYLPQLSVLFGGHAHQFGGGGAVVAEAEKPFDMIEADACRILAKAANFFIRRKRSQIVDAYLSNEALSGDRWLSIVAAIGRCGAESDCSE